MSRNRYAIIAIILALVIFGASLVHRSWWPGEIPREQPEETVTIGMTFAGDVTLHGTEETRRRIEALARLAEERINAYCYDIGSRFGFQVHVKDYNPHHSGSGREATEELKDMGISLVVGHESSQQSEDSLIYANENDILLLSPAELEELAVKPGDNLFSLVPMPSQQGAVIAKTLLDMGRDAAVVIQRADMRTSQIFWGFSDAFTDEGGTILERFLFYGLYNYTSILSSVEEVVEHAAESHGEEHVAIVVLASDAPGMLRDAVDYRLLLSLPWFGTDKTIGFSSKGISAVNRLADVDVRELLAQVGLFSPSRAPAYTQEYYVIDELYIDETGGHLDFGLATKYDCLWILALSVIEADSPDATDVKRVLPPVASRHFGITGSCALNEDGVRQSCSYDLGGYYGEGERMRFGHYNSTSDSVKWLRSEYPLGPEDAKTIEIYQAVIQDMYDRSSHTRGRRVPIFISPIYRTSGHSAEGSLAFLPQSKPSDDKPLLLGLLEALEDLPAEKVSFAPREEVVSRGAGGRVRGDGAFITLGTTIDTDFFVVVEASIYYGNVGAEGYRYVFYNVHGSWEISEAVLVWMA